jgi:hypothetical protein
VLGSQTLRRDADVALAACERHLAGLLVRAPDDFCLCHGAAGAGDALLHTGAGARDLAAQVGRWGLELYGSPGATRFPCGVPLGDTPGLLPGFAGIGMFYLRLSDPGVHSALLMHPPDG